MTNNPSPEVTEYHTTLQDLMTSIVFEWLEQWWPVLRGTALLYTEYGGCLFVQVTVDLLGTFSIESMSYETPLDDELSESELVALQSDLPNPLDDIGGPLGALLVIISTYWFILDTLITLTLLVNLVTIAGAIGIFLVLWGAWLLLVENDVRIGRISLADARSLTLGFAIALAGEMAFFAILHAAKAAAEVGLRPLRNLLSKMKEIANRWGVWSFIIKLGVFVITMVAYARYYDMSVQEYLANQGSVE